jgi:DNA-nicking Smr family endonuclease
VTRHKPRGLRADEKELWYRVARTARPLHHVSAKAVVEQSAPPKSETKRDAKKFDQFEIGSRSATALPGHNLSPSLGSRMASAPVRMDAKTLARMKRGKSIPEARIDLHGMILADAHAALTAFILRSHAEGKRLVLVITGKGRVADDSDPIPTRTGVIKHQLPHWLASPPLRSHVLQVTEAHQRHGGSGAFYVYLSRRR